MNAISRRKTLAILLSSPVLSRVSYAAPDEPVTDSDRGPFGLTWGKNTAEVRSTGVSLEPSPVKSFGISFVGSNLPKVIADVESTVLSFGYNDKLWRVAAIGRSYENDPSGGNVLSRYLELKSALADRYGPGNEHDSRDQQMFKAANEYIASIKEGRASRFTSFSNGSTEAELSIRATSFDTSYFVMLFSSTEGAKEFEASKHDHEKDAL
jgi:hypothetical protein